MPRLTRPLILRHALPMVDADGDVSMRKLASSLSVTPMALYRHYPGKDALLADIVEKKSRELDLPEPLEDPVADTVQTALYLHDFLVERPWMIRLIATARLASPRGFAFARRFLDAAGRAGRGEAEAFVFYRTVFATVLGLATITARKNAEADADPAEATDAVPAQLATRWGELDRATGPVEVLTTVAEILRG